MELNLAGLQSLLSQNLGIAFLAALLAGIVSSFSPCVLSAVPLVVTYVGGYAGNDKKTAFKYSLVFCFGLALTFTILGALSAVLGRLMLGAGSWWYIFLGVLMTLAGLQVLGVLNILPQACGMRGKGRRGLMGAFFLGIVGGALASPCSTPVLIAILAFVAGQGNLALGIALLAVYSIGHCALLLLAGTSVGFVQHLASSPGTQKIGSLLQKFMGVVILLLAFYLFYLGF